MASLIREYETQNMLSSVYIVALSGDDVTSPAFRRGQMG